MWTLYKNFKIYTNELYYDYMIFFYNEPHGTAFCRLLFTDMNSIKKIWKNIVDTRRKLLTVSKTPGPGNKDKIERWALNECTAFLDKHLERWVYIVVEIFGRKCFDVINFPFL